ncbi:hypothetical protein BV22DRAFT_1134611 [Leucogyrophana mollusca]|uniref:Uncharacterized protein n=1 Tax=Leucogyrophana mollusca TaxID=85980 RepID=A0ACB8AYE6_9AGAM|nr:hypothetical protein BV22DRAFT_1134611 [Leucogyrophana mollusca]
MPTCTIVTPHNREASAHTYVIRPTSPVSPQFLAELKPATCLILDSARRYIYERRNGLAALLGGVYVVSRYVNERLEKIYGVCVGAGWDVGAPAFADASNAHEAAMYTITELIAKLSEQILEETDVEGLTHELQSHSKSRAAIIRSSSSSPLPAQSKPPSDREPDAWSVLVSSLGGDGS